MTTDEPVSGWPGQKNIFRGKDMKKSFFDKKRPEKRCISLHKVHQFGILSKNDQDK